MSALENYPNAYNELIKTEVQDKGNELVLEFRFAQPLAHDLFTKKLESPNGMLISIAANKLAEKGWATSEGVLLTDVHGEAAPVGDGRVWRLSYRKGERLKS